MPLPKIEYILEDLKDSSVFFILNIFAGYWQIRISEKEKEKINVVSSVGSYKFELIPFGPMNGPFILQRMMEYMWWNINFARFYLDDVFVFSSSIEELIEKYISSSNP